MSDPTTIEAIGETVGEAKWSAMRELERRFPGLDRSAVEFQILSEGERGLMGVGREPARVIGRLLRVPDGVAAVPAPPREAATAERDDRPARGPRTGERRSPRRPVPRPAVLPPLEGPFAAQVEELVSTICNGIGLAGSVGVFADGDDVVAVVDGEDLGVLIGKHGHTIDAVQYLVNAILHGRDDEAGHVTVDAQNYRARRRVALHEQAERAARDALRLGREVALEPMSSAERKTVHVYLQDRDDVETASEGKEPRRFVVVRPVA